MSNDTRFFDWSYAQSFADEQLTTYADKAQLYAIEAGFRETLYACAGSSSDRELGDRMRRTGLALFRPDALQHNKIESTLEYFARLDIRPYFCSEVWVSPQAIRELWRYQLNVASGSRIRLLDLLFEASPSVLVLLEADAEAVNVPCSAVMADAKGEADPAVREGWELRSHLRSPHRIEVYVHVADEPVDVVRDGGILLGPAGFAGALETPKSDVTSSAITMADRVRREYSDRGRRVIVTDALLRAALGEIGWDHLDNAVDRWAVLRELGTHCEMYAGPGENIICAPGTDEWWARAGLLNRRTEYLSSRAGAAPTAVGH